MKETTPAAMPPCFDRWCQRFNEVNQRRLDVMNQCNQTKISRGFSLIIDDSGHRKSGNFTEGVGRQYIGQIGKTDNGVVVVTSHLYDGKKSLPLDIELYKKADSLPWEGNEEPQTQTG
jgi:SRSO17 transposase